MEAWSERGCANNGVLFVGLCVLTGLLFVMCLTAYRASGVLRHYREGYGEVEEEREDARAVRLLRALLRA